MLIVFVQPFPWGDGDKSLIHNPKTNPCPPVEGGTEEDVTDKPHPLTEWIFANLMEDREEKDKERWEHLAAMQERRRR